MMEAYVLFTIIGIACLLFIAAGIFIIKMKQCHLIEKEKDEIPESKKYDMSPSEVHEYKDFEKAMAGEIYAEKEQHYTERRLSPTPLGMEKFRRIPSLASERSRSKKSFRSSTLTTVSPPDETQSSACTSIDEESTISQKNVDSHLDVDGPLLPVSIVSLQSFGGEDSFGKDGPMRPISNRTIQSFAMNRFSSNPHIESPKINGKKSYTFQDVELFSIANDEAAL